MPEVVKLSIFSGLALIQLWSPKDNNNNTNLFLFLCELFPASSLSRKVADAVDPGQLALDGLHDVHVVRDVHVAHVSAGDEHVLQPGEPSAPVPVVHVLQADVHEGVHVDHAAPRRALVPQLHRGHLALQPLQQHHQAVLRDGAFADGADDLGRRRAGGRRRGLVSLRLLHGRGCGGGAAAVMDACGPARGLLSLSGNTIF